MSSGHHRPQVCRTLAGMAASVSFLPVTMDSNRPITAGGDGQKTADSVEKVGHGLRIRKVRVRD